MGNIRDKLGKEVLEDEDTVLEVVGGD